MNRDEAIADIEAAKPIVRKLVPGAAELVIEGGLDLAELIITHLPEATHAAAVETIKAWLRAGAKATLQLELERQLGGA